MGVAKLAGAPRSAIRLDAQAAGVIAAGETGRRGAPRAPPRMQGGLVASHPLSPLPPTSGSPESGRSPADPAARHDGGSRNEKSRAWPSAWLCLAGPRPCTRTSRQRRVLAQDAVAAKSGGIVAIPRRSERLERTGVLILLDAINRQRDIAEKMRAKGDDRLARKDNRPTRRGQPPVRPARAARRIRHKTVGVAITATARSGAIASPGSPPIDACPASRAFRLAFGIITAISTATAIHPRRAGTITSPPGGDAATFFRAGRAIAVARTAAVAC